MITAPLNFSEFDAAAQGSLQERYLSLAEIRELPAFVGNDSGIFQTIAIKAEQPNERRLERVVNAGLNLSGAHQASRFRRSVRGLAGGTEVSQEGLERGRRRIGRHHAVVIARNCENRRGVIPVHI